MQKLTLEEITIIIPTYKRSKFLFKNLKFWESFNTNIIVLDGSHVSIKKKKFDLFKNNIKYFFKKNSNFEERLYLASLSIKTPYCVILGDDEIHSPWALNKSINFLKKNRDYGCCIGRCVGFKAVGKYLNLWPEKTIQSKHFVNQKNSLVRLNYHIKNYTPSTLYAVHKLKSFKFSTKLFKNFKFDSPYIQETVFELLSAAYSKCKVLSYLSWFRNFENNPVIDKNSKRLYFLSDWFNNKKNLKVIKELKKSIVDSILKLNENDKKTIRNNIDYILNYRVLSDKKNLKEAKLRYKFKDNNFVEKTFNRVKIFFKFILIKKNIGEFCFFIDKKKYNYYLLHNAKIKFITKELNFINSFLLGKNDIKNR